jgi:hypothetical protein
MSIASMSGYLSANSPTITTLELPLTAPASIASGPTNFPAVNAFVVPAGTWILSSHINVKSVSTTTPINIWICRVCKDGTAPANLIAEYAGGTGVNYFKASTFANASPPFVSNGTNTLTIQIECITGDASDWTTYIAGTDARVYLTKIAN